MKIRHLQKIDAATVVDDNNKPSEEKVATAAPQDDSEKEAAGNQASVILGNWTKTALDEDATATTQLQTLKRSRMKAAPTADNYILISSDNFIIDTNNQ